MKKPSLECGAISRPLKSAMKQVLDCGTAGRCHDHVGGTLTKCRICPQAQPIGASKQAGRVRARATRGHHKQSLCSVATLWHLTLLHVVCSGCLAPGCFAGIASLVGRGANGPPPYTSGAALTPSLYTMCASNPPPTLAPALLRLSAPPPP